MLDRPEPAIATPSGTPTATASPNPTTTRHSVAAA